MRPVVLLLLAAGAIAAPVSAAPSDHAGHDAAPITSVSIGYRSYSPSAIAVLAGEHIRFTNDSVRAHTVTADDDSFDSGRINSGKTYDLATAKTGDFPFHCSLHPGITGKVAVRDVLLAPPASSAPPGRPYPLNGRTTLAPQSTLTIQADSGEGWRDAGTATVQADGTFTTQVTPTTTASYRAVAGETASDPVRLIVLDSAVALSAKRSRGRDTLSVTVTPASPGALVVLQLYLPDRFGWWPVQRAKLDARSQARFVLKTKRRLSARVRLTLADAATALAQSATVRVGAVRRATHKH
jgi:plastocyanin